MEKNGPDKCCHSLESVSLLLTLLHFRWCLANSQESGLLQCLEHQCISHLGLGELTTLTLNLLS